MNARVMPNEYSEVPIDENEDLVDCDPRDLAIAIRTESRTGSPNGNGHVTAWGDVRVICEGRDMHSARVDISEVRDVGYPAARRPDDAPYPRHLGIKVGLWYNEEQVLQIRECVVQDESGKEEKLRAAFILDKYHVRLSEKFDGVPYTNALPGAWKESVLLFEVDLAK